MTDYLTIGVATSLRLLVRCIHWVTVILAWAVGCVLLQVQRCELVEWLAGWLASKTEVECNAHVVWTACGSAVNVYGCVF